MSWQMSPGHNEPPMGSSKMPKIIDWLFEKYRHRGDPINVMTPSVVSL
jgi:hypothetical protein